MKNNREVARLKRHRRIKLRMFGEESKPRLIIHRSLKNLFIQVVDDSKKRTVLSSSTMDKEVKERFPYGGNVKAAVFLGEVFARKAKEKGIKKIIFDRAGLKYHGRVKAFADSLRKGGVEF
ncbi:MAG: 50S ribosomal protein L18 [Candidatus Omnitrophota bacterium]|jgi:large subunit ribosomal protein L18|nr:MAG: 50S ribosomal protein L18 [Candidatus Omnitrophota bacterium]